jgi:hypothetical protein
MALPDPPLLLASLPGSPPGTGAGVPPGPGAGVPPGTGAGVLPADGGFVGVATGAGGEGVASGVGLGPPQLAVQLVHAPSQEPDWQPPQQVQSEHVHPLHPRHVPSLRPRRNACSNGLKPCKGVKASVTVDSAKRASTTPILKCISVGMGCLPLKDA